MSSSGSTTDFLMTRAAAGASAGPKKLTRQPAVAASFAGPAAAAFVVASGMAAQQSMAKFHFVKHESV
eukprot:1270729-Prymnesium_polylepis.1